MQSRLCAQVSPCLCSSGSSGLLAGVIPCCSQAWDLFKGLTAGPSLNPCLSDLEERISLPGEMRSKLAAQEVLMCGCGQVCL